MLSPKHMYKPVMEEEGEISPQIVYIREPFRTKIVTVIGTLIVFIATFISGYFTGNMYTKCGIKSFRPSFKEPLQLSDVVVKFTSNRRFLQHPDNETEELWKTLYPKDTHGLFEWGDNPERAGFAAFHQLHCVDALRRGYYQREDTIEALSNHHAKPDFEHEVDETHMLHCIEFLRQSVMCHADTTVQLEAEYHQGIMAFGVEYQCKNWWQLVDWVNKRNADFPSSN